MEPRRQVEENKVSLALAKGDLVRLRAYNSSASGTAAVGIVLDITEEHKIRKGNKSNDPIVTEYSYGIYWVDLGIRVVESSWDLEKVNNEKG